MNKQNSRQPPAIFLMGPTASGKTNLAVALAETLPCDIISVDSALVYKDMNIGTAKPSADVLARAPHRLISFIDPSQVYSVAEFREDALREIADITSRGRIPLLVGGTMMYFKALSQGLAKLPSANESIRKKILTEANDIGWKELHKRLSGFDPRAANRIKPSDTQRLQRALEVYEITGRSLSDLHDDQERVKFPCKIVNLAVAPSDRTILHNLIALRFNKMLENGFYNEVKMLHGRKDLNSLLPSIRAVGYRQMWSFIDRELSYDEMVKNSIGATRQLAKRQFTWLRSWSQVNWLDSLSPRLLKDTLSIIDKNIK